MAGFKRFGMARRRCESNGERDTCRNQEFRYGMKEGVYSLKTAGQKFIKGITDKKYSSSSQITDVAQPNSE